MIPFRFMGCAKKMCENRKKTVNIARPVEMRGATRILFYSISAVVRVFITRIRIKENECAFSLGRCAFLRIVLYKIWKKLSP